MSKKTKKILAVLLTVSLLFTSAGTASAKVSLNGATTGIVSIGYNLLDSLFDIVLGLFGDLNKAENIPTIEEYDAKENEYFYDGTDGNVIGAKWSLGYASTSVIPTQWRVNADGEADPNGYCLKGSHYFGGYFSYKVSKIYDDQSVNLVVMSNGCDSNRNGVADVLIFAALDGVGIGNADILSVREASVKALKEAYAGFDNSDVIGFNMNVTHAHTTIDPEGMSVSLVGPLLKNKLLGTTDRSVEKELIDSIVANTSAAVVRAYGSMENGRLYYFETEDVGYDSEKYYIVGDKRDSGVACQDHFACFYFEGSRTGEKTILANIGMHPTKASRTSEKICADVPHYIGAALAEKDYNFVFIQGAQAAIGLNPVSSDEGAAWAQEHTLSYEDWVERYGEDYAAANYNDTNGLGESEYTQIKDCGYTIAKIILDALDDVDIGDAILPILNVAMDEIVIPLDYSFQFLGSVTKLTGFNTVKDSSTESGYALEVETGYVCLGGSICIVLVPGEISPALIYGTQEGYTGDSLWCGPTSLTGKDWAYNTLESEIRAEFHNDDLVVLTAGLCNDAIGYIMPDTSAESLAASIIDGDNENMISSSVNAGSAFMDGYLEFLKPEI